MQRTRGKLVIVGMGYRPGHLTIESLAWLRAADRVFYLLDNPVLEEAIRSLSHESESLRPLYDERRRRAAMFDEMVDRTMTAVRSGLRTCIAFSGHPGVLIKVARQVFQRAHAEGYPVQMLPGVSIKDCLIADLVNGFDNAASYEAHRFLSQCQHITTSTALIIWQAGRMIDLHDRRNPAAKPWLSMVADKLSDHYPHTHEVVLYEPARHIGCRPHERRCVLGELSRQRISVNTTLFVPAVPRV